LLLCDGGCTGCFRFCLLFACAVDINLGAGTLRIRFPL
jgi:hypothetical protein